MGNRLVNSICNVLFGHSDLSSYIHVSLSVIRIQKNGKNVNIFRSIFFVNNIGQTSDICILIPTRAGRKEVNTVQEKKKARESEPIRGQSQTVGS